MDFDEAKNTTQWMPINGKGSLVNIGTCFLVDQSGNFLIDQSKNFLVSSPNVLYPLNATAWTATPAS